MTLENAKRELLLLLSSWKRGEIDSPWHVQDQAESIEQQLVDCKQLGPQRQADGLADQVKGVLDQLSNAQAQYVLPEDIDVMRELLEAPELDVKDILTRYSYYWDTVDYSSREAEAREYWFGKKT
ncbi:hypothetical protein [Marinobacter sp. F3R11]|uniref:hypothetical protein n=1 Tax=Marinobacter sp. F3R11 TaxID=2267231 RepID=UPI000DE8B01D|nr:hypothetical protein [Marinobacter sp. F3R11]RBW49309.1 hypothetical protein DS878_14475 [Marinobacter sp. F3R11]